MNVDMGIISLYLLMELKMQELMTDEVNEVSGAWIYGAVTKAVRAIAYCLYEGGMNSYYSGQGDAYLEAVRGGNMGA
jgi:hypothetical protein